MSYFKKYSDSEYDYDYKESEISSEDPSFYIYQNIENRQESFNIRFAKNFNQTKINKTPLMKIFQMSDIFPEEQILFVYYNPFCNYSYNEIMESKSTTKNFIIGFNEQQTLEKQTKVRAIKNMNSINNQVENKSQLNKTGNKIIQKEENIIHNTSNNFRYIFLIYLFIAVLNTLYFIIECMFKESIKLFHKFTLFIAFIYIFVGLFGFLFMNSEKKNKYPLILVILSNIFTIGNIYLGYIQFNGKPSWFINEVNEIALLYEILIVVLLKMGK
jgi:heme/copper-type cytochrome/quinol oxidase subunit 4